MGRVPGVRRAARAGRRAPVRAPAPRWPARALLSVGGARHLRQSTGNLRAAHKCALNILPTRNTNIRDADGGDT